MSTNQPLVEGDRYLLTFRRNLLLQILSLKTRGTFLRNFTFMLPCIVLDFFLNNQPDALIIPILFCYKTLHISGIFSAHHPEFSTVHSALVSFIQVYNDCFQADSGWSTSGGVVVKTLRYKPAGGGFNFRWCHWNFSVT